MGKFVKFAVALDAMHFARTGDEYRVREASAVEKAAWPQPFDPKHPHLRTVVRRADGASVTIACQSPGAFGDYCDEEIAAQFEAELDAAIGEPVGL